MRWRLLALTGALGVMLLGGTTVNLGGAGSQVTSSGGTARVPHNVVVILWDDWGIDQNTLYYGASGAITPNFNTRAATGVRFTNFNVQTSCSPTRASLLLGQNPIQHGIGVPIAIGSPDQDDGIPTGTTTIATVLRNLGYSTLTIGKWHVAGVTQIGAPATHAHSLGFTYFEGLAGIQPNPNYDNYTWYDDTDNPTTKTTYNTTFITDRALAKLPPAGPFFMQVNYNAPHTPLHCPSDALTATYDAACTPIGGESASQAQFHAMLEALDAETNRLVAGLNLANTTVMIFGDNGTNGGVIQGYNILKSKGTPYLGGTKVPLIVFGERVTTPGTSTSVLSINDIPRTILQIAGAAPELLPNAADSVSFYGDFTGATPSTRVVSYHEIFTPTGQPVYPSSDWARGAAETRYHLVRLASGVEELYDIQVDPFEATPLNLGALTAPQQASYNKLKAKINNP